MSFIVAKRASSPRPKRNVSCQKKTVGLVGGTQGCIDERDPELRSSLNSELSACPEHSVWSIACY